ncbi:hypothetical protein [Aquimarina mytili]|uniref:Uncharacterized protein n=1 Tax=Aquimarina mytili TaxID=874423 RepID=A0A937D4E5_9FLAO|nr:hypothetical protein [Aquimarina mytili]MBL0682104.1 hypothetical protein [Aquimarina mytili]
MRFFIILIILFNTTCKSNNHIASEKLFNDSNYLLYLSKEKTIDDKNKRITLYKNIPFQKVLNKENGNFKLLFENEIVFEGTKKCLFLLEVFNNEVLLISTSNTYKNKFAAGPENFERNKVILIDIKSGKKKVTEFVDGGFLKNHRNYLNKSSTVKNVFAIQEISYKNDLIKLEDIDGNYKKLKLIDIELTPFKCD